MITIDIEKKIITWQGQQVLKIKAQYPAGSIVKVYGPSGAGKTTMLKAVAGFIRPEHGIITFNGETWLDTGRRINLPPQQRLAGFVFQDYALFPNMTAEQHLAYATRDKTWIKRLLATGRLEALAGHKPRFLSGGQQQRLAILRALAIRPRLLLMDEPFSAIDPETKAGLITDLKTIFGELEATVFIVSHNSAELDGLAGDELKFGSANIFAR